MSPDEPHQPATDHTRSDRADPDWGELVVPPLFDDAAWDQGWDDGWDEGWDDSWEHGWERDVTGMEPPPPEMELVFEPVPVPRPVLSPDPDATGAHSLDEVARPVEPDDQPPSTPLPAEPGPAARPAPRVPPPTGQQKLRAAVWLAILVTVIGVTIAFGVAVALVVINLAVRSAG